MNKSYDLLYENNENFYFLKKDLTSKKNHFIKKLKFENDFNSIRYSVSKKLLSISEVNSLKQEVQKLKKNQNLSLLEDKNDFRNISYFFNNGNSKSFSGYIDNDSEIYNLLNSIDQRVLNIKGIKKFVRCQYVSTFNYPFNKSDDIKPVPFCFHIDRLRFFRVMIYLTDVLKSADGPFQIIPLNKKGLKKFSNIHNNFLKTNTSIYSYPHRIFTDLFIKSIKGKMGTTIFFDGLHPHKGGIFKAKQPRQAFLIDYEYQEQYLMRKANNIKF
tara:strand:- start:8705 stop:9517 length:813 start_codon:yes stop_codon:yes gene_type:complete